MPLLKLFLIGALSACVFLSAPSVQAGTTDMVKIFMRTNGKVRNDYCEKKFKDKALQSHCVGVWEAHVKKECGSSPYKKCFFDEDKIAYMKMGDSNWTSAKKILDAKLK